METLIIDNFKGTMTSIREGDINSGMSYSLNTFANDPFVLPGNLTWSKAATQIDPTGSVITDLIMAGKERVESGVLYVYAIGHTGRVYKIQVNDPNTYNPDYDNPVLLTTITTGTPTFTRGGFMDFFGATEKIYIGHDKGVTSLNFDGTGEAVVGVMGSWVQTVPRPIKQFIGKLYIGNGNNLAEIDSTATVTSYTKLSPAFPTGTQVRDIDISIDGNYLQAVVTALALPDITTASQDTTYTASSSSNIFKWNGTDTGYTAFDTFPTFSLTGNIMFGPYQYTFGYDQNEMAIFNPTQKIITATQEISPLPNAISSTGNLVTWMAPLYFDGHLELTYGVFGPFDRDVGLGYWCTFGHVATSPETDIIQVPCQLQVSNFGQGSSSNGYVDNIFSTSKVYFSTLETSSGPTTAYRLFKWSPVNVIGIQSTPLEEAVYETQTKIFSKKVRIGEVRVYGEPWVAGNSFQIDIIGSDGMPIAGSTQVFTAGTNLTIGDDFAWYNGASAPTYAVGLRVTNLGTTNHIISKVEIDVHKAGK